jgi:hypothetical protein
MIGYPKVGDRVRAAREIGSHIQEGDVFAVVGVDEVTGLVALDWCRCGGSHGSGSSLGSICTYRWGGWGSYFQLEERITPEEMARARSMPSAEEALEFMRRKP